MQIILLHAFKDLHFIQKLLVLSVVAIILVGEEATAVPVTKEATNPNSVDFKRGFDVCCPETQKMLGLPNQWKTDCLNEYSNFQKGYDQSSEEYYRRALNGLGMNNAKYNNALFWSSNGIADIFNIILAIAPSSPPTSANVPAGVFGNCINEMYKDVNIIIYWFEYSRLMAQKSASYVFWLTTGDDTTNYFPNRSPKSIFEIYELPNLLPPTVPGLTVLNAKSSSSSKGLTCSKDTKSRDKLKSVNSKLAYYCCDISMTNSSTLDTINKVIAGMHYS